jgi:cyanophycinase
MANIFLIGGGGDQPGAWPDTYGRFLQAAGGEKARLALVAVGATASDATEILAFNRNIFLKLELPPAQILELPLIQGQHLETSALAALEPSGVCVCGTSTPLCHQVLCQDLEWVHWMQEKNLPYCGVSSGAVVAGDRAVMGGWRVTVDGDPHPFQAHWASEGLDDLEVRPGLGLAPFAIECHAGQWGTLTRMIHAVAMELVDQGWAIDEDTLLELGVRGIYTNGLGHTYRLQIHHMGRVEVSLFRDGGGVMRG